MIKFNVSILLAVLFLAITGHSEGTLLVFSDVDDTIKISYVRNKKEMVSFSVFSDSLFYGMNDVYQGVAESYRIRNQAEKVKFHYVSNGWRPTVEETHKALLNDFGFPDPNNYYNRRLKEILKKYPHKKNVILNIVNQERPSTVVLIGDNGESDPKVYDEIVKVLSDKFQAEGKKVEFHTFIHMVYEKNSHSGGPFPGQHPYVDSADLTLQLFSKGLIEKSIARVIFDDISKRIKTEPKHSVYGPLAYPFFKARKSQQELSSLYQCRAFYSL